MINHLSTSLLLILLTLQACQKRENLDLYSVLVAKDDVIVFEDYTNGATKDDLHNIQSLTKSLMSILIGIAIDEGHIEDENVFVNLYFEDAYQKLEDASKSQISIKHLLNQTSGLSWKGFLEHSEWQANSDPIGFVLQKDLKEVPGEWYNYNSGATHLLSAILSKSVGKSTLEYAREKLFNPLNIKDVNWRKMNDGYHDGGGLGLEMKTSDLLKIGVLLINSGQHEEQQIVSKSWVQKMFDRDQKSSTRWGLRKSKHGFCWYSAQLSGQTVNYGMGYGGQFIILLPESNVVIASSQNHDVAHGLRNQNSFLRNDLPALLEEYGADQK